MNNNPNPSDYRSVLSDINFLKHHQEAITKSMEHVFKDLNIVATLEVKDNLATANKKLVLTLYKDIKVGEETKHAKLFGLDIDLSRF
jgi:hypothetical protein